MNEKRDSPSVPPPSAPAASQTRPLPRAVRPGGWILVGVLLTMLVMAVRACIFAGGEGPQQVQRAGDAKQWTCSMHPQIRQGTQGPCPLCGMDLIPVADATSLHEESARRVTLSARARALSKLRTTKVVRQSDAAGETRLLGQIEADETTLKTVTAWTGGRVDRLLVKVTGERVSAGQVIAMLYSPEVFAAHQDLLTARAQVTRLAGAGAVARTAAEAAFYAARERLRLLGVPERELEKLALAERPARAVAIRSPFAGTVIERLLSEGAYVQTGTPLYRIADLGRVWLQLDAYESDLPLLKVGQAVTVTVEALPDARFEGTVRFIDPTLDPGKRTAQVRVVLDNREQQLRPNMFAHASVKTSASEDAEGPLVVPATAPLFTGRRAIVYVELPDAEKGVVYEARTVRLGPRLGSYYPVVAGLAEGEWVVSRGAFVLDADLQIRGGQSMMTEPDDEQAGVWDAAIELTRDQRSQLSPVVLAYLAVQRALAQDDLPQAKRAAQELGLSITNVDLLRSREADAAWRALADALRHDAQHVAMAADLEAARSGFEDLSGAVSQLLQRFGNPTEQALQLAFCPMAAGSAGASWIQEGSTIDNSYFGESMRTCGELKQEVAPGQYLQGAAAPERSHDGHEGHRH